MFTARDGCGTSSTYRYQSKRPPVGVSSRRPSDRCSVPGGYLGVPGFFSAQKVAQVLLLESGDSSAGNLFPPFVLSIIDLVTLYFTIYI